MSKSFWANLFAPPREKFSLEELHHLHMILLRNQVITDGNRETVVEALRSISELVIWGDQHDASIVEYFLTENLLGHFHQILLQKSNRRGNVAMQVLQTLSILIQNIKNQQTVYYLFSNDHINDIASLRFDFEDDEVLGYYVNLLKTISLRLNEATVQFFFHSEGGPKHGGAAAFPLYTEATKFVAHRDAMVRAAVKTLTLNVYTINLPSLREFLCCSPAAAYFDRVAAYAAERCAALDRLLNVWDAPAAAAAAAVETCLAEIEDVLSYCNDVMALGAVPLRSLLFWHLWNQVGPVLFLPLESLALDDKNKHSTEYEYGRKDQNPVSSSLSSPTGAITTPSGGGGSSSGGDRTPVLSLGPLCSVLVSERMLYAVTDPSLVSFLVASLLGGSDAATEAAHVLANSLQVSKAGTESDGGGGGGGEAGEDRQGSDDQVHGIASSSPPYTRMGSDALLAGLRSDPAEIRRVMLGVLHGNDAQLAAGVLRLLAAVLSHKTLPEETLEAVGLLPRRRRKQRELLEELTRDMSAEAVEVGARPLSFGREKGGGADGAEPVNAALVRIEEDKEETDERETETTQEEAKSGSFRAGLHRYSPHTERVAFGSGRSGPAAAPTARGDSHFVEIIDAVLAGLKSELLPPLALGVAGWVLHRLLAAGSNAHPNPIHHPFMSTTGPLYGVETSRRSGGSQRNRVHDEYAGPKPGWMATVRAAMTARQETAKPFLTGGGQWADAVLPMLSISWDRNRDTVLRGGPGPLHVVGLTWAQGALVQELTWQLGGSTEPVIRSNAAVAAKATCIALQALIGVSHIEEVLATGQIRQRHDHDLLLEGLGLGFAFGCPGEGEDSCQPSCAPPVPPLPTAVPFPLAVPPPPVPHQHPTTSPETQHQHQQHRRQQRWVHAVVPVPPPDDPSTAAARCKVAFKQGSERSVVLTVLNSVQSHHHRETSSPSETSSDGGAEAGTFKSCRGHAMEVLRRVAVDPGEMSAPVAALLDPDHPGEGKATVLSAAPLLGTFPYVETSSSHPEWLHVVVRPSVVSLVQALLSVPPGLELSALDREIACGHWIVAFGSAQNAVEALEMMQKAIDAYQEMHAAGLASLVTTTTHKSGMPGASAGGGISA